ncbi:hypothetical protein SISSUDRAFT_1057415 [Sistotremastrum suecicum HHB10207 ss-3]|uniref:Fork-head domain-containing protein n=1 Tax=Sistotremastrum suecicum HHB10207 ss-3 TaxID=1314776 RepID=A0A166IMK4_9AGAM|nr:hypothetical protein SISSUDRAFT_1057415 [Sistotremastrum suecicum HHB10207 ss-3]
MFDRVPRPLQEPGKGSYWTVDMQASAGYKRLRKRKSQGKPQRKGLTAPLDIPPRTAEQLAEAERGRLRAVALWTTGKVPEELGSDYSSPSPEADSERQNAAGDHQPVVNVWSPNHSLQEQSDLAAQSIDPSAGVPESPLQDDDIRAENQRLRTQCQTFQREDDRLRSQIATLESQLEEAHGEMARIKGLLQETQISQEDHRREVVRRQVAEQIAEEQTVKARAAERKLEAVEKECREPFVVPALYQAYLKFLEHPPCDAAG